MAIKSDKGNIFDQLEDEPDHKELPDEIQEAIEVIRIQRESKRDALGKLVAKFRDSAITGRANSGIETVWIEDEEFYLGIDDNNRSSAAWTKGPGVNSGVTTTTVSESSRCTSFFNITAQFVDSCSSRMGDILLPAGDWNFTIRPTPVENDDSQIPGSSLSNSPRGLQPGAVQPPQQPPTGMASPVAPASPMVQGASATPVPPAAPIPESIHNRAVVEKGETRIKDWLTDCHYHAEVRKVLEDCTRIGTGILKGPVPSVIKAMMINTDEQTGEKKVLYEEKVVPASYRIDPWNFFPDPNCGDNIHDGNGCVERDLLTARSVRELKGLPGYISEQIDKVLDEGPGMKLYTDGVRDDDATLDDGDLFEVWYFYGNVDISDLSSMNVDLSEAQQKEESVPAVVTLVNEHAIKAFVNPLDTGGYPYDVMPWQVMSNTPWGQGVARKGRVPQQMLLASARNLMDNAGLSSGPILVIRPTACRPADGDWTLKPRKIFIATEQADTRSVSDFITSINIPSNQKEMSAIIETSYKMMEDSTSMAYLMQGQQGSAPDTVGGMELLNRNASAVLRRMARTFDEKLTEPHIKRYYDWLLKYGEDDEKSDMVIEAVGSSALVEREIQAMETQQLLQASLNPAFGLDPKRTMAELLKIKRMSPDKFQFSEEDLQKMASVQKPTDPAIQVAQINAQNRMQIEQMKDQSERQIAQLQSDLNHFKAQLDAATKVHGIDTKNNMDTVTQRAVAQRDSNDANLKNQQLLLQERLAMLTYANARGISLEKVKASLAELSMKLNVQKELSIASLNLDASHHASDINLETKQHDDTVQMTTAELALESKKHAAQLQLDKEKHFSALAQDTHKHMTSLEDDQVMTPPVEVSGRARPGQAFER